MSCTGPAPPPGVARFCRRAAQVAEDNGKTAGPSYWKRGGAAAAAKLTQAGWAVRAATPLDPAAWTAGGALLTKATLLTLPAALQVASGFLACSCLRCVSNILLYRRAFQKALS